MYIKEKLNLDMRGLIEHGPITIVAFGDSVTHGALVGGEINYESAYWNRLRMKLNDVRSYMPVNVINAGIGGISARNSVPRLDKQVIAHNPDLVIVCFGLNDVNGEKEVFADSLEEIFTKCKACGADVIYMTPNMMNTYVDENTESQHKEYAAVTADYQNSGRMDEFMDAARAVAAKCGVPVCDCYAEWKKLSETTDTTQLLINKINHPTKGMHELFARMLFDMIMGDDFGGADANSSTMYSE